MEQDQELEVTAEEFKEWVEHSITKSVVKNILEKREYISNFITNGNTISKDSEYTTDFMVGQVRGLTELFHLFTDAKEDAREVSQYGH